MKCNFGKDCEWWLQRDWVGNNNKEYQHYSEHRMCPNQKLRKLNTS